jgi:hypothetical protein
LHFGQAPRLSWPLKSGVAAASPDCGWPKSNSVRNSSFKRMPGGKRLSHAAPEPRQRPDESLRDEFGDFLGVHSRPETTFHSEKSHFWHWNLR